MSPTKNHSSNTASRSSSSNILHGGKYIIYARKSSEAEERQVQSIDDQIQFCTRRAQQLGVEIIHQFIDEKSAKDPNQRVGFNTMMQMLEKGGIDGIITWKLDRLSRNPVDAGSIQYALQRGKIEKIITSDREYHPMDAGLIFSVETGMANQYILDLSKNAKRGIRGKADRGGLGGSAPHGYRNNRIDKTVEIDPDRFHLVKRMWSLLLHNRYSLSHIVDIVNNEWGFRTIKKRKVGGKPMTVSSLSYLFHNPFYAGCIRFHGEILKGAHTPMITFEEYEEGKRILSKYTTTERPKNQQFAFRGSMFCGDCGCAITAEEKIKITKKEQKKLTFRYYHCSYSKDRQGGTRCSQRKYINETVIEKQILEILSSIEIHPDFVLWAKGTLGRLHSDTILLQEQVRGKIEKQMEDARKKLPRLLSLLMDEAITQEEYKLQKNSLEKEISSLERKRDGMNKNETHWIHRMEDTLDFVSTAKKRFIEGNIETKKHIFHSLGSNLILLDEKVSLDLHPWFAPFRKITQIQNERAQSQKTPLERFEPKEKSITPGKDDALNDGCTEWLGM